MSDLGALTTEGIIESGVWTRNIALLETTEPDLEEHGGTVNLGSSFMPFSHSVQHLCACQRK